MRKVLVTGGSGFVGGALLERLSHLGFELVAPSRRLLSRAPVDVVNPLLGELSADLDWSDALIGVSVVIHIAARVHVLNETAADPLAEFRKANVDGTLQLAKQSKAAGVQRFIFISSIGVNGSTTNGRAFKESSSPAPHSNYAVSKHEAELELQKLFSGSATEYVIIRPPLVYDWDAPGNFARLLKLIKQGFPLPFGSIDNRRGFVSLENLIDFITCCVDHPAAANQLFLISDGEDISTRYLVRTLALGMGRKAMLLPVPTSLLGMMLKLLGRDALNDQLCGSLEIDSSKARNLLSWHPPKTITAALEAAGKCYTEGNERK